MPSILQAPPLPAQAAISARRPLTMRNEKDAPGFTIRWPSGKALVFQWLETFPGMGVVRQFRQLWERDNLDNPGDSRCAAQPGGGWKTDGEREDYRIKLARGDAEARRGGEEGNSTLKSSKTAVRSNRGSSERRCSARRTRGWACRRRGGRGRRRPGLRGRRFRGCARGCGGRSWRI